MSSSVAMEERPPINKRPQMRKSSLGATIRNTGMSTRHIYEMQVKTANYEAMMQRFQLRKVSDMGLASSKFEAENLVIDKENGGVKKKPIHQSVRFSLQRMIRALTRWKTWRKFFHSLGSPITPTSRIATVHGIVMLLTYHFQLFYLPFGPAYYPNGSAGIRAVNVAMELIFLLNLLLNFNTAYQDQNTLVTSRQLIARNYLNKWFIIDFLSATPRCGLQYLITGSLEENTPLVTQSETALMVLRVLRVTLMERAILLSRVVRISKAMVTWLRYSRFSHLLGIAQLMWLVLLIAHYMACLWHIVSESHGSQSRSISEKYVADYYYAVSLIQGQGNIVGTTDENLFSTVAILVGSVILAIVFGNVAMLVSNFNASTTNYHRKMEAVFATMDKMHLPDKLRDRIHQYYTHVWTEYECLDGDIVKFQRELTHTLGLEVGLYKYMNLVTEIPFWKDCSPDFATQIILNLAVRVYLPDDYVVRKGETCDEMFMINRGICALSYTWDSETESEQEDEDTDSGSSTGSTRFTGPEPSRLAFNNPVRGSAKFKLQSDSKSTSAEDSSAQVRPQQYRLPGDALKPSTSLATDRSVENADNCETQLMYPGETTGEMGLIMNHMQAGSIRAVTYVEMCILDRATFQRLISRYPKDRRTVLTHLLCDSIEKGQFPFSWDEISGVVLDQRQRRGDLGATVDNIHTAITPAEAAHALVDRLDVELHDKTIKFGLQGSDKPLEQQLPPVQGIQQEKRSTTGDQAITRATEARSAIQTAVPVGEKYDDNSRDELLEMVRALTGAIARMENDLKSMKERFDRLPTAAIHVPRYNMVPGSVYPAVPHNAAVAVPRSVPPSKRLTRGKTSLDVAGGPFRVKTKRSSSAKDMNGSAVAGDDKFSPREIVSPAPDPDQDVVADSLPFESKQFNATPGKPVLLHPRSRRSVIDITPQRPRPSQRRSSIRRLLSTNLFNKQATGPANLPPSLRHSKSSGRSRGPELSLADQLWNRQSSDSKISADSPSQSGEATTAARHAGRSLHRSGSARSDSNFRRRDSRLQSFPESPLSAEQNAEDTPGSPKDPGREPEAAWQNDDSAAAKDDSDSSKENFA